MKNTLMILLFACMFTAVQADNKTPQQVKQEATEIARGMINTLQLNEHEYLKVKELIAEKLTVLDEVSGMYANDPEMLKRKLSETESAYQKQLAHVLNPKQLDSYLSLYGDLQE